ncbi:MAG TPA: dihydrofolate reductase [Euzebyales bacterium]
MRVSLIVAAATNDVIGREGDLPWHVREDLRRFRHLTLDHALVVGRRTHQSIVDRLGRPLDRRLSVVVTRRDLAPHDTVVPASSTSRALGVARAVARFCGHDEVFVIGGATIYEQALDDVDRIHLTRVLRDVDGDTLMPAGWLNGFRVVETSDEATTDDGVPYRFETHDRV